jgi:hypothetical protein
MKDFLKKNWTIVVIVILLLFIALSSMFSKCNNTRVETIIEQVDISTVKRKTIDSMASIQAERERYVVDSADRVSGKKIRQLEKKIVDEEQVFAQQLNAYNADSSSQTPKCDSLISQAQVIVYDLHKDIDLLKASNANIRLRSSIDSTELIRCTESLYIAYDNIDKLKNVKINSSWWQKNDKYVYLGVGIAGTMAVIKLASTLLK